MRISYTFNCLRIIDVYSFNDVTCEHISRDDIMKLLIIKSSAWIYEGTSISLEFRSKNVQAIYSIMTGTQNYVTEVNNTGNVRHV